MGRFGIIREHEHRERVAKKHASKELMEALRDTWLTKVQPDHPYVQHLNRRIKVLDNQLKNMRP